MTRHLLYLFFFLTLSLAAHGHPTRINAAIVEDLSHLAVSYDGRICPVNTVATDFVSTLSGERSWQGYSADEIFLGWMIYYTEWEREPIILVDNSEVQEMLGIHGRWASLRDCYTGDNEYKLAGMDTVCVISTPTKKAIDELNLKLQLITRFYNSELIRIFPLTHEGCTVWHAPGSTELPQGVGEAEFQFINHAMDHLTQYILTDDAAGARTIMQKIRLFQEEKAGNALPSEGRLRLEVLYNRYLRHTWPLILLFLFSLPLAFAIGDRKAYSLPR